LSSEPKPSAASPQGKFTEKVSPEPKYILQEGGEYQFIDPSFVKKNWAGHEHWRPAAKPKVVDAAKAKGKGRGKKEALLIDFETTLGKLEMEALFAPAKQATTIATTKAKKASDTTLPPDIHYDPEQLLRLFQKPDWKIVTGRRMFNQQNVLAQDGANWYNYQNPNDNDFVPDDNPGGDGLGDRWDDDEESKSRPVNTNVKVSAHLVEEPEKAGKQTIGFASRAKQVDVKLLKGQIWDELCAGGDKSTGKSKTKRMTQETTFSQLLVDLGEHAAPQTLRDVSVSYCLICLLHLANENNLVITGTPTLDQLRMGPASD